MRRYLISSAVLALLIGAGWLAWQQWGPTDAGSEQGGPPADFAMPVLAQEVRIDTVLHTAEAVGSLRANESITLRPELDGVVKEVLFTEGQRVEKGELLVLLDDSVLQAELVQAEANLTLAQRNYQRAADLAKNGSGTARARDEALADLHFNEASLALAQARIAKTSILAPFGGLIGLRHFSPGDYVTPGQELVSLEEINPIKVDFRVSELYFAAISAGQDLIVTVDALPGESFNGKILAIDPQVDINGRALVIRAVIPNDNLKLHPGLFARINVVLERREQAILVPEAAIVPKAEGPYVFTVVDGIATPVPVTIGLRQAGEVEIVSGLQAGDLVITDGQMKLYPGMPVAVQPPADAAPVAQ